jgi:PPOX class probable F420-dependent enzyme
LDRAACADLLITAEHGVLATVHPLRGVDTVPVCFVADRSTVAIPVDRVKPKSSTRLQRVANLERDPRASLLCDRWDGRDWSRLWWVRASLRLATGPAGGTGHVESLLRAKYPQYVDRPFAEVLLFTIVDLTGWSGADAGEVGATGV